MKTPLIAATLLISASTVTLYAQQESSGVSHPPDDAIVESTPQPAPAKAKPSAALPYSSESATTPAASSQPTFKVIGPVSRPPAADNPDADIVTEVPPSDDQVESHLPAQNPSSSDARPAPTQIASSQGLSPALKPRVEPNPDQGIVTEVPINPNELPSGTELRVRLTEEISTTTTTVGTPFHGEIIEPVMHNGQTIIPAGAELRGHVTEVRGGRRIKGSALIHLEPQSIVLPDGSQYHLNASVIDSDQFADTRVNSEGSILHRDHAGKTLAAMSLTTGSAAAAGAVFGGGVGALVGAGIGAGVSTVWWLKQDRQTHLPKDTTIVFNLTTPLPITPDQR